MNPFPVAHWGSQSQPPPDAALLFDLPLMYQLWPTKAGSPTPTFSCANGGGTVQDWEGVLRKCKPNEARFPGARRVENMIGGSSQNLTVAPWTAYNVGLNSAAPVLTWNYNSTQATRVQLQRGNDLAVGVCSMYQVIVVPLTTAAYRLTVDLWTLSNPIVLVVALSNQINNLTINNTAPVRYSFLVSASFASAPSFAIGLYGTNSGGVNNSQAGDLMVGRVQFELISGQSNTNPGEYQTLGMGGTAYSNVDGVRCYGVKLGNTMTGNVVNEIAGTVPINVGNGASAVVCDTIGPTGLLMDQQQTVAYGIEWDFSTVSPSGMSIATKNVAGPTGDYYGCAFIETAGSSQHYFYTSATLPFAVTNGFFGVFAHAGQRNKIQVQFIIGPDQALARYSLTGNGAVTAAYLNGGTGTFRGAGIIPYAGGWYFCWVSMSGVAAGTAMTTYVVAEDGAVYGGSGLAAWYLYGMTVMDTGSDPYTPCQYAVATRGTDTLSFPGSGNMVATVGTAYAEIRTKWQTANTLRGIVSGESYKYPLMIQTTWPSTSIAIYDGTNMAGLASGLPDANTKTRKVAASWGGAQQMATGGGLSPGASAFAGTMTGSTINVGYSPWTSMALGGQLRNVKIWNVQLTASELGDMTSGSAG
jgi:hypothetical protein